MFENLEVLRLANGLSRHAGARQSEIAQNVANADTPGFRARDIAPFETYLNPGAGMAATRPGHLQGDSLMSGWRPLDMPDGESPNGNSVSLEDQMVKAAEVQHSHDLALTVYSTTMGILRTSIGKR